MDIQAERENGIVVVMANGRIDSSNAREFHSELENVFQQGDKAMVLDFDKVAYISSAGMRVILLVLKSFQKNQSKFAICNMNDSIREVFSISGFDKIIDIHGSRSSALAAVHD